MDRRGPARKTRRFGWAGLVLVACLARAGVGLQGADWIAGNGYRSAPLPVPASGRTGFTALASSQTGITFTNLVPEQRHLTNQIFLNGSGVAAGDVDGDGLCDVFFCRLGGPSALYRNLGHWKFEDISRQAGVECPGFDATGAAFADLDGDGHLDLVVNSIGGGTRIFFNDGKGRFTESERVLNPGKGGMSLALGDLDGDGYLDLYVANYRTSALMDMPNARATFKRVDGRVQIDRIDGRSLSEPDLTNRFEFSAQFGVLELGQPDALYRNRGGRDWVEVPFTGGAFEDEDGKPLAAPLYDWGLSVMIRDINGDGLPDIYVCNDFQSPDRVWINQGSGRFRALPRLALRKTSRYSMGIDFADINRDGYDDFVVLDMLPRDHRLRLTQIDTPLDIPAVGDLESRPQYGLTTLFLNRGDGTYAEVGRFAGLDATDWSWTPVFLDVDLDGWEDLLVSNGQERAARDFDAMESLKALRARNRPTDAEIFQARRIFPRLATPNLAFRNQRDGTFREVGKEWGFALPGVSQGMCLADLDNDGDLDVVVNNFNGPAGIYRNETAAPRVAVRLKGAPPNTRGIGARIRLYGGPAPVQSQEMICGGRYLSSDDPMRVFAAGAGEMRLEVTWRSGKVGVVDAVQPNRVYEIDESGAREGNTKHPRPQTPDPKSQIPNSKSQIPDARSQIPIFEDVSGLLAHRHHDEPFDDFGRQALEWKLSQLGPGVSWCDLDGDGWDDLLVGTGKGGQLAAFQNDGHGGFRRLSAAPWTQTATRDQTTLLGWRVAPGRALVLVGSANYEDGLAVGSAVRVYDPAGPVRDDLFPAQTSSPGPMALTDLNGDGRLSLFVGGRVVPGRYPEPAASRLFRQRDGRWEIDRDNTNVLARVGLVSGAVFSDLTGDGRPELILACEWGPIRILRNDRGSLVAWDPPVWGADLGPGSRVSDPGKGAAPAPTARPQPPDPRPQTPDPRPQTPDPRPQTPDPRSQTPDPIPQTRVARLSQLTGWWTGVTTGDLDGDGRLDIIAANWGRNTPYESHRSHPLRLYYGDLDGHGAMAVLQAYYDEDLGKEVPEERLDVLARDLPFLRERFPTHRAFAEAGLEEILGERAGRARYLEASTLESMVLLNRGDHFEARPLPAEAQWAPALAVCVADFDGDGNEDVFLSQNFFPLNPANARCDAGRGLWLRGDGRGNLAPVPGQESGIAVYGDQRGAAVCDYDGDGRVDLVVTQNGAQTRLFHNVGGRPGLRVRLQGPVDNAQGIGAQVRLIFGQRQGPIREIHAGSGYWSQDSPVAVLAAPESPTQVEVRWPGGRVVTEPVPAGAREITVDTGK